MLTILALRTNWYQLDLYENEAVNLTYSFQDVQKVNNPAADYSQTFRVPLTERNQRVFGAYDLSQVMPFDIKRKTECALLIGGVEIMRGFLQVKNWYVQKGQFVDLELVFFGGAKTLAAAIGEAKLSDLNWASFNHDLTYSNVTDSWDGNLYSGQIRYGIVDRGANWRGTGTNPGNTPLLPRDLTPFIRVKTIVEKIFTTYGFTLQSSFLNNASAMYAMLHNGKRELKTTSGGGQSIAFYAGFTTNTTFTAPSGWTTLQLSDGGNFYDLGADFASGQWQVPATGTYYMRGFYSFDLSNPAATLSLRLYNTTTSTAYPLVTDEFDYNTSYQWGISTINTPFGYALDATGGHTYVLQFQISFGGGNVTFYAGATNGLLGIGGTSWNVHGYVPTTAQLDVARNMPDIRCIDFLLGLQRCFNLVFVPDKYDKTKISVEPINDYLSAGTAKDWTNKIDLTQDIAVSPTSDLQRKTYTWTHAEGNDIANQAYQQATGYVYGRHQILDPANDFAQGEEALTSGFSPFLASYIPGTNYLILRLLKSEGEDLSIDNLKPHLAFWNGAQSIGFEMNNVGTTIIETFPLFTAYESKMPDCADDVLLFGIAPPQFPIIANPQNTLYFKYWSQYVIDMYSSDARILTAKFRLNTLDIGDFNWNDIIRLYGNEWRVLEISGFDATQEGCVTIKLLKRLNAGRDCENLPYTGRTGKIEFTEPDGTGTFLGGRECCERYGFFYDSSTGFCYQPE
jgi:hypothetical protein